MDVLTVPKTIASLEYTALRLPLTLVETQVVARLFGEESGVRLGFEKALGTVDMTVGRWIGDDRRATRGAALSRRAEVLAKAVRLEQKAATRKEQATSELHEAREAADQRRKQADRRAHVDVQAVRTEQKSETRAAEQKAQATASARRTTVEQERKAKLDSEQRRLDSQVSSIDKRTSARAAAPKAQLDDAVKASKGAAKQKQTAARLGRLADAEKTSRTTR